jgi:beta-phosphoglucomutase-like phosphatase (HAD superfamily)
MALRALIFDVDGTLADTEELHRRAFNAAFAQFGLSWNWGWRTYAGLLQVAGGKERIAHFIARTEAADKERLIALIPRLHAAKTELYAAMLKSGGLPLRPGIVTLIAQARAAGLRLAIATTTTPVNVDALLRATLGPDAPGWFAATAAGDDAVAKKPAPDIYRVALARLDLAPADCLAFEDSANGVSAAKAAGLCVVAAPTRWSEQDDLGRADLVLGGFDETGPLSALQAFHSQWRTQRATVAA